MPDFLANSLWIPSKIFTTSFLPEPQETALPPERAISTDTSLPLSAAGATLRIMLYPQDQAVIPTWKVTVPLAGSLELIS